MAKLDRFPPPTIAEERAADARAEANAFLAQPVMSGEDYLYERVQQLERVVLGLKQMNQLLAEENKRLLRKLSQ